MHYTTEAALEANIPATFLTQALDDNGDGQRDPAVLEHVLGSASRAVDALLGQRYRTPFAAPVPVVCGQAAAVFACELCYQRRGTSAENNPWTTQAKWWRDKLSLIARGEEPLTPDKQRARPSVSVIDSRAKTHSSGGLLP